MSSPREVRSQTSMSSVDINEPTIDILVQVKNTIAPVSLISEENQEKINDPQSTTREKCDNHFVQGNIRDGCASTEDLAVGHYDRRNDEEDVSRQETFSKNDVRIEEFETRDPAEEEHFLNPVDNGTIDVESCTIRSAEFGFYEEKMNEIKKLSAITEAPVPNTSIVSGDGIKIDEEEEEEDVVSLSESDSSFKEEAVLVVDHKKEAAVIDYKKEAAVIEAENDGIISKVQEYQEKISSMLNQSLTLSFFSVSDQVTNMPRTVKDQTELSESLIENEDTQSVRSTIQNSIDSIIKDEKEEEINETGTNTTSRVVEEDGKKEENAVEPQSLEIANTASLELTTDIKDRGICVDKKSNTEKSINEDLIGCDDTMIVILADKIFNEALSNVNAKREIDEINETMITTGDVTDHLKEIKSDIDSTSEYDCTSNDNGNKVKPTKTDSLRKEESSKPHIEDDGLLSNLHQKMNNMIVESLSFFSVDTETNAADEAKTVLPNPSIVDSSMNSFGHTLLFSTTEEGKFDDIEESVEFEIDQLSFDLTYTKSLERVDEDYAGFDSHSDDELDEKISSISSS